MKKILNKDQSGFEYPENPIQSIVVLLLQTTVSVRVMEWSVSHNHQVIYTLFARSKYLVSSAWSLCQPCVHVWYVHVRVNASDHLIVGFPGHLFHSVFAILRLFSSHVNRFVVPFSSILHSCQLHRVHVDQ